MMNRELFLVGAVTTWGVATVGIVEGQAAAPGVTSQPDASPPSPNSVSVTRAAAVDETTGRTIVPVHRAGGTVSPSPSGSGTPGDDATGGVLTDIAFEYNFPGYDRIFIQNAGAADSASDLNVGDVSARGFVRYTTSGSYVEFYESNGGARGQLLDFFEPLDSLGRGGKLLKRIDVLGERADFEARTHYAYSEVPEPQRTFIYGKVYYGIGDDAEAIRQFNDFFTQPSVYWNGDARLLLAAAYENMDDVAAAQIFGNVAPDARRASALAKAFSILDYVARHTSNFPRETVNTARVGLARIARTQGDLDEALRQYDLVLADPTPTALYRRQLVSTRRLSYTAGTSTQARQARHDSEFGKPAAKRANDLRKSRGAKAAPPTKEQLLKFAASGANQPAPANPAARVDQLRAWASHYDVMWTTYETSFDPPADIDWLAREGGAIAAHLPSGSSASDARNFCKSPYFHEYKPNAKYRFPAWFSTETQIREAQNTGTASVTLHFAEIEQKLYYAFNVKFKQLTSREFNADMHSDGVTRTLRDAVQTFQDEIAAILGPASS